MNPLLRCLIALGLIAVGTVSSASAPGALQFSVANFTASESAGTATINVSRINGTSGVVAVSYTASNGTATAGVDFAVTSGFLIWADGDAANKSFTVSLGNDAIVEGDETVNLSLGSASGGATLGTPATATLTILDDDGVSSLVVSNHSFEFPAIAAGTFSTTAAPPGWSAYGNLNFNARTIGVLRPGTTTLYAEPAPLGQNVGVIFLMDNPANQTFFANLEAGMRQTLAATLQTRRQYTLRVEVGNIANDVNAPFQFGGFPNYRIDLLAGTNVLASDNNSRLPGEGRFLTTTVAVATAASHPFAGQPLGIRLVNLNSAPGIEVNWDNVRLESSPLPPPALSITHEVLLGRIRLEWQPGQHDPTAFAGEARQFGYLLGPAESAPPVSQAASSRMGLCGAFAMNAMAFSLPRYLGML